MNSQLVEGNLLVQNGITAAGQIHISHHICISHSVIVAHINHNLFSAVGYLSQFFRLRNHSGISAHRFLQIIIGGKIHAGVSESHIGIVLLHRLGKDIHVFINQIRTEKIITVSALPRCVGHGTVNKQFRSLLTQEPCSIREGKESVKNIAVIFVMSHTLQIEVHAQLLRCGSQIFQILLAAQIRDEFCLPHNFLVHAAITPACVLHRNIVHALLSQLSDHVFRLAVPGQLQRPGDRNTQNLLHLIYGTHNLKRYRDTLIIIHVKILTIFILQITLVSFRHIHIAVAVHKAVPLGQGLMRQRLQKLVDVLATQITHLIKFTRADAVNGVHEIIAAVVSGNVRLYRGIRSAFLHHTDKGIVAVCYAEYIEVCPRIMHHGVSGQRHIPTVQARIIRCL